MSQYLAIFVILFVCALPGYSSYLDPVVFGFLVICAISRTLSPI